MHHPTSPFPSTPDPNPNLPEHQHLNCPRCHSSNTKFCYYNNYNLSQPRHFCKNCRRYWTKGGTLRNIPIGGGTRKITKRPTTTASTSSKRMNSTPAVAVAVASPPPQPTPPALTTPVPVLQKLEPEPVVGGYGGMGSFGNLLMEGLNFNLVSSKGDEDNHVMIRNPNADETSGGERGGGESASSCWNVGGSGWPDLSIFTPGSSFH